MPELTTQQLLTGLQQLEGFDPFVYLQLKEDTSTEVALKILSRFVVTLEESESQISSGLSENNPELIWKACHKVAGTSELLGFMSLGHQSRHLNKELQANQQVSSYMDEISHYKNRIQNTIVTIKQNFSDFLTYN